MNCPLCDSAGSHELFRDDIRSYRHCKKCGLIFVPEREHVGIEEEKKRYAFHENSPDNEGYVRFLNELVSVITKQCPCTSRILDYGSGKEAVLTRLLKVRGYDCTPCDPLYGIGTDVLDKTYDTVVLCEVVEHLRDLEKEIDVIKSVAGDAGKIIIRTQLYPSLENFAGWWYKYDITHVNFFNVQAISQLAAMLSRKNIMQYGPDIFIIGPRPFSLPDTPR